MTKLTKTVDTLLKDSDNLRFLEEKLAKFIIRAEMNDGFKKIIDNDDKLEEAYTTLTDYLDLE